MTDHPGENAPPSRWTLTCRSMVTSGRWADLRCIRFRWHLGHHRGGDLNGPTWMPERIVTTNYGAKGTPVHWDPVERFGGEVVGQRQGDGSWTCKCGLNFPTDLALYRHRQAVHFGRNEPPK